MGKEAQENPSVETAIECSSSDAEPEAFSRLSGMSCSILEGDGHFSNNLDKSLLCFRNGSILCKIALFFLLEIC